MSSYESFRASFKGDIVAEGDADYEESIFRWSTASIRRAKFVAFVKDAHDVALAIHYAKSEKLPIAIRGGGHSASAASSIEGGLVVDLSRHLNGVTIDPVKKLAYVQGGALWGSVDKAAIAHGLASVGGTVSHTGVAGLTLGGGYGYLSCQHGLVIDNLEEVTMVLADGSQVIANEKENADLFWAIRGGGCNFGVCLQFVLRLHEQRKTVYTGAMIFPEPLFGQLMEVTEKWWLSKPPPNMCMIQVFTVGPPPISAPCVIIFPFYNGSEEEGRTAYKPFLDLKPIDHTKEMPFEVLNTVQNAQVDHGQNVYQRTVTQEKMDLAVSSATFKKVAECWKPDQRFVMVWEYFPFEKVCEVPNNATAFNGRGSHINIILLCMADVSEPELNKSNREKIIALTDMVANAQPNPDGSKFETYGNYNGDEGLATDVDRSRKMFGENYPRLQQIKKQLDPENIFNKWFPISPAP